MTTVAVAPTDPPRKVPQGLAGARVAATNAVADRFFAEHADAIAITCRGMADRFQRGGRLLVSGDDAQRSDMAHVVVEFVHPVVVGKRALPAIPLPDVQSGGAVRALATLGMPGDIFMLLCATDVNARAHELLTRARGRGMLTIALTGVTASRTSASALPADHVFTVPSADACIVQETQEMLYHVLWELVHVFFDHRTVHT